MESYWIVLNRLGAEHAVKLKNGLPPSSGADTSPIEVKTELTMMLTPDSRRIDAIAGSLRPYIGPIMRRTGAKNPENASILCDYIIAENEMNINDSTKECKIKVLVWLSAHFGHEKSFRDMTKQDILTHLNALRRPGPGDPSRRWIGTYNNRVLAYAKFFRWLYSPDEPAYRLRHTPPYHTPDEGMKMRGDGAYTSTNPRAFQDTVFLAKSNDYHENGRWDSVNVAGAHFSVNCPEVEQTKPKISSIASQVIL